MTKLKIGNITLPGSIVLSPMAGVTDAPFREIARQNGADYTISEMLTSQTHLWTTQKTQLRLDDKWNTGPKILQIGGASPEIVAQAALRCQEISADIIEINMGCPAKKVCNVLAGSALLRDEKLVEDILTEVIARSSVPITLKTRLGWDHDSKNILRIAKLAENIGISGLTIHGRTRNDLYNGYATYDLIAEVKSRAKIPVFANGDIDTPEKAKHILEYTQADGLYIGRGTLGKPWLLEQIKSFLATGYYVKSYDLKIIKAIIKTHFNYIYEHYPEPLKYRFATKHLKWYCQHLDVDKELYIDVFSRFSNAKSVVEQLALVDKMFN